MIDYKHSGRIKECIYTETDKTGKQMSKWVLKNILDLCQQSLEYPQQ